jgi:hypothetical protein
MTPCIMVYHVLRGPLPRPLPPTPGKPTLSEVLQQMRDEDDR